MIGIITPDVDRLKRNEDIKSLLKCLKHKKPEIRSKAFIALQKYTNQKEVLASLRLLVDDPDANVRTLAIVKFAGIDDKVNYGDLRSIILNGTQSEKIEVLRIIADRGEKLNEETSSLLVQSLNDKKMMVQFEAMRTMGALKDRHLIQYLAEFLTNKSHRLRTEAVKALGHIGIDECIDHIIGSLGDSHGEVRASSLEALKMIDTERGRAALGDAPLMMLAKKMSGNSLERQETIQHIGKNRIRVGIPFLIKALSDEYKVVRIEAIKSIGVMRERECIDEIGRCIDDKYWDVRLEAVKTLEKLVDKKSLEFLEKAIDDSNTNVKQLARKSYNNLKSHLARLNKIQILS